MDYLLSNALRFTPGKDTIVLESEEEVVVVEAAGDESDVEALSLLELVGAGVLPLLPLSARVALLPLRLSVM